MKYSVVETQDRIDWRREKSSVAWVNNSSLSSFGI